MREDAEYILARYGGHAGLYRDATRGNRPVQHPARSGPAVAGAVGRRILGRRRSRRPALPLPDHG